MKTKLLLTLAALFPAGDRWLELEVRTTPGPFNVLSPRQALTPTPYALTASNLSGTLPAAQVSGVLPSANLGGQLGQHAEWREQSRHRPGHAVGAVLSIDQTLKRPCRNSHPTT